MGDADDCGLGTLVAGAMSLPERVTRGDAGSRSGLHRTCSSLPALGVWIATLPQPEVPVGRFALLGDNLSWDGLLGKG